MYQPNYPEEPDWQKGEGKLFAACVRAIQRLAKEHPGTVCSYLGFDSEPYYGYVMIGFETPENSLKVARRKHAYEVKNQAAQFQHAHAWKTVHYFVEQRQCPGHSDSTGYFKFEQYEQVEFPEWQPFAESESYPEESSPENGSEPDYLEAHVILIFWKVIERLIAENALAPLELTSPFRLGYNFHDSDLVTVRIINWPDS